MLQTHLSIIAAHKLQGKVVGYISRKGSKGGTLYALDVEYQTRSGETLHITSSSASSSPSRNINDSVIVLDRNDIAEKSCFYLRDCLLVILFGCVLVYA